MKKLFAFTMLGILLAIGFTAFSTAHSLGDMCKYDLNNDGYIDWKDYNMEVEDFYDGHSSRSEVFDMWKAVKMFSKTHLDDHC